MSRLSFVILFLFSFLQFNAQTSSSNYRVTLNELLGIIEERFEIHLNYSESLVENKELDYGLWRLRPQLEESLRNVLSPFDLVYEKRNDSTYRITPFAYHRRSVGEGRASLLFLSSLYENDSSWEQRKVDLRKCFFEALDISSSPKWASETVIITNKRTYRNYTVENISLETLPGVYLFGSIYKPVNIEGKVPVVVSPNGHFSNGRYNKDVQNRCAMLAQMGAVVINYDLFAWGESELQFESQSHRTPLAMTMQILNGFRALDYLLSLDYVDTARVGITGGSGGGSQTMLLAAIDDRYTVSVPAVMLSSWFYGGCPCESGQPVHLCGEGTNNAEIAAMFAPKPMLVISDGGDWTSHVPQLEFPYLQRIYRFYNATESLENVHLSEEGHNYGINKRIALYDFMSKHLDLNTIYCEDGKWDESNVLVESAAEMQVFGESADLLPKNALKSFKELSDIWNNYSLKSE